MSKKTPIERLLVMAWNEKPQAVAVDLLAELDAVRDWAEALTELVDAIDEASGAVEEWTYAEGREDRADAREAAVEALTVFADAVDAVSSLDPLPEGVGEPIVTDGCKTCGHARSRHPDGDACVASDNDKAYGLCDCGSYTS